MPIYEFYCQDCHTVFSFFSPRIDTETQPDCPRCKRRDLPRRPSRFATLKHRGEDTPDPLDRLDDARLEGAMDSMMEEMGRLENDEDPRVMGQMMRRFSQLTGLEMGEKMEDLVKQLDSGADPEALEQEFDDESMEDFFRLKQALVSRRERPPVVDDELYYL